LREILGRSPLTTTQISELVGAYEAVFRALEHEFDHEFDHKSDRRVSILEEMEKMCNHYKGTLSMLLSHTDKVEDPYNVDPSEVNLSEIEDQTIIAWMKYVSCHRLVFIDFTLNCLS
jgi:hypothetical protein